jgi:predicted transcriptional regulator
MNLLNKPIEERLNDVFYYLAKNATASQNPKVVVRRQDIAQHFGATERSVGNWLKQLRERGWIDTRTERYYRPGYGWCNTPIIYIEAKGLIEVLRRQNGIR